MVRRRALLTSLVVGATQLLAGCSSDNHRGSTKSHSKTTTTDTSTEVGTSTPATETTDTLLDEAQQDANRAASLYTRWGGSSNSSYLGVRLDSEPDSVEQIDSLLSSAQEKYQKYTRNHDDVGAVITKLNFVQTLDYWVRIQVQLNRAYLHISRKAIRNLYSQNQDLYSESLNQFDTFHQKATNLLKLHRKWKDQMEAYISGISPSVYDAKILQFETGLHSTKYVKTTLNRLQEVLNQLISNLEAYLSDDGSSQQLSDTIELASSISSDIQKFCCATESVDRHLSRLHTSAESTASGLEQLTLALSDNDTQKHERKAKEAFESSSLLMKDDSRIAELVSQL